MNVLLLSILFYAALTDLTLSRIPNSAVLALLLLGGLQQLPVWTLYAPSITQGLMGLGLGLVLMMPFYFSGVLGAGDAKLLAALGLVLGAEALVWIQLLSLLFAGLFAMLVLASQGQLLAQFKGWYWSGFSLKGQSGVMQTDCLPFGGAVFLAALAQQLYF